MAIVDLANPTRFMALAGRLLPFLWAATAVLLGLTSGLALQAAPASKPDPRTDVIFFERQKFTDVRDSAMETPRGRDAILAQIKDYIVDRAKWYVRQR